MSQESASSPEDEARVRAEHEDWEPEWMAQGAGSVQLELRAPGRRPIQVQHTEEWAETSAAGTHLTSDFELGTTVESEVLPSGNFELVARLPGGRFPRREVTLIAGEVTSVRLRFD